MALPSTNIFTNKFSIKERFLKLYRKLYNSFIKDDIVHKLDYKRELIELNARISLLEVTLNATLGMANSNQIALYVHTHPVNTAVQVNPVTGTGTGAGVAHNATTSSSLSAIPTLATKPVIHDDFFSKARNAALLSTGPAIAPLADSVSPEGIKANIQVRKDIGS